MLYIPNTKDMGIYVHIPFCKQKCSYCDFPSYEGLGDYYDQYVTALVEEIHVWTKTYPESASRQVVTLYAGGGTPSELNLKQWQSIMDAIGSHFRLATDAEITLEANPHDLTLDYLQGLRDLGFNRISFGIQSFQPELLALLRRGHTKEDALAAVPLAREAGFKNVSIDFIYGLPKQTMKDLEESLNYATTLGVDHVSIYGLQLEEGTLLKREVDAKRITLPDEDTVEAMYDYVIEGLQSRGFERYEISNFAKHGAYSRHNTRYWQYVDYLGFGSGAHSFYGGVRRFNKAYVVPYIQDLMAGTLPVEDMEIIDDHRHREDYTFLALRTKWGIDEGDFEARFGESLTSIYGEVLTSLMAKQLLIYDHGHYRLTPLGAKHGNYVFAQFID